MQIRLVNRPGRAVDAGLLFLQPADAAPDRDVLTLEEPLCSPVKVTAIGAVNQMGKRVLPAVHPPLSCAGLHPRPAHHLLLHLQEKRPRDDGLVAVLDIVLWDDSLSYK